MILLDITIPIPTELNPSVLAYTLGSLAFMGMMMALNDSVKEGVYKIMKVVWTKLFLGFLKYIKSVLTVHTAVTKFMEGQKEQTVILHEVQKDLNQVKAGSNSDFKRSPEVRFRCNAEGENYLTTDLYRAMVGVTTEAELSGIKWLGNVSIKHRERYIHWAKQVLSNQMKDTYPSLPFQSLGNDETGHYSVSIYPITYTNGKEYVYFEGIIMPVDKEACSNLHTAGKRIGIRGIPCICGACDDVMLPVRGEEDVVVAIETKRLD